MRARIPLFLLVTLSLAALVAVSLAGRSAGETAAVVSNGSAATPTETATATPTPMPTIDSVTPNRGPSRGDTIITISGSDFDPGVAVTIDGVPLKQLLPVKETDPPPDIRFDENTIKGRTPALVSDPPPTGDVPVDVVVTNPGGASVTLVDGFTYTPPPTVTGVSPDHGSPLGGTEVTITGTNFLGAAQVVFGDCVDGREPHCQTFAVSYTTTVVDANTINTVTPAHVHGTVDVLVINPDGQESDPAGTDNDFEYDTLLAPTFDPTTPIDPASGPSVGGTEVTITGTNFVDGAVVTFDGEPLDPLPLDELDDPATTIRGRTPPHPAGTVDVVITNADGQSVTETGGFTFDAWPAPTIAGISPANGKSLGGEMATITGTNFAEGAVVTFGGSGDPDRSEVPAAVASGGTTITVMTPSHPAGTVDVVVTNPDDGSVTESSGFTYDPSPAPTIASIDPAEGPSLGGTPVMITGTGFHPGAEVTFGDGSLVPVALEPEDDPTTIIRGLAPPLVRDPPPPTGTPVSVDVVVTNPDGQIATESGGFTYDPIWPAPTITGISPATGDSRGGTPVTITGANFAGGATVFFGSCHDTNGDKQERPCGTAAPKDDTTVDPAGDEITTVTPGGLFTSVNVTVMNPDGQFAVLHGEFLYTLGPGPTLDGTSPITPTGGPSAGGTEVTINGGNFADGVTVMVGDRPLAPITPPGDPPPPPEPIFRSETMLMGETPPGPAGTAGDVAVLNPDSPTAILADGFYYCGDETAPETVATASPPEPASGWYNSDVSLDLTATDPPSGEPPPCDSGVKQITYWADDPNNPTTVPGDTAAVAITNEGLTAVGFFAEDKLGNIEDPPNTAEVRIDKTAPTINATAITTRDGQPYTGGQTNQDVEVTFTCSDDLSGVASIEATGAASGVLTDGGLGQQELSVTVTTEGDNQEVQGTCTDVAGNTASTAFVDIDILFDFPALNASASAGGQPYVPGTWTNQNVTVTFTCEPIPGGTAIMSLVPPFVNVPVPPETEVSDHRVTSTCTDYEYNASVLTYPIPPDPPQEPGEPGIYIDKTRPEASASAVTVGDGQEYADNTGTWTNQHVTVTFACEDPPGSLAQGSGVASVSPPVTVSKEGSTPSLAGGCSDNAGNNADPPAYFGPINIDKTEPSCSVFVNPNPLQPTGSLTTVFVTVTVTDALSGPAGFTLVSVDTNEPDSAAADIQGFTIGDPDTMGQLRATRGRVYTLTYEGMDVAGNTHACSETVTVGTSGPTSTPTATPTSTPTPTCIDRLGDSSCDDPVNDPDDDGCTTAEEAALGSVFDPNAWYDIYDVPVPAKPDADGANGTRDGLVNMSDVLAVLLYAFAERTDICGDNPNADGVDYDCVKGVDLDGDTDDDVGTSHGIPEGVKYDRSAGLGVDPVTGIDPAGPPDGAIGIDDVLVALAQAFVVDCSG